jgi:hypothetical protein
MISVQTAHILPYRTRYLALADSRYVHAGEPEGNVLPEISQKAINLLL